MPTQQPAKILNKLIQFKVENHSTPTIRQLAQVCDADPSSVRADLAHLESTGHVIRDDHAPCAIRILKLNYDPQT